MAKILLVDNDPEFLKSRAEVLEKQGYPVVTAESLEEARGKLRENRFDLALIDVRLTDNKDPEDFSGLALAREMDPSISIILYSGYVGSEALQDLLAEGRVIDFSSKELEPMLQAIQNALERRRRMERRKERRLTLGFIGAILTILGLIIGIAAAIMSHITFFLIGGLLVLAGGMLLIVGS